ncbi:TRAP transporter substrate-binding protein DctP [Billgrantia diversa]|uniref:TRAP transporter substrate-binding protein DctP n=1 Tax=Halomonas sp. MCCC 1A13316 TaxID=2733487 RepID=UPI0018A60A38|nr:TRAP transporter substrate-binding protein DctP [Halomonas sp. MCCC 1A13316]QOR37746.1 TRAP transporter substrate-binding protein DctP [Halomonas sp. MCCC 1A13316]
MKFYYKITILASLGCVSSMVLAEPVEFRLATDSGSKGSPVGDSMERWASIIEENTKGTPDEISVDIFYQDELGDQKEVFDLLMVGEVDMMINWPMTSYDRRMGLRNVPYLFLDWEEAFAAYKTGGWLNDLYSEVHEDMGLKFFGAYPEGFAGVATRGQYATTVEGADGLKIRVPGNFPNPETMQAMGYAPVSITWGEVYTSLQTGVVDGDGGNVIYWDYEYFRDVLDYYVRTRHNFVTGVLSMNQQSWEQLNKNQKEIVADAAAEVSAQQFEDAREFDQSYVEKAIEAGMKYIEPSEEELQELALVTREKVWPQLDDEFGSELVSKIRERAPEL